jgi:hypothetical protein
MDRMCSMHERITLLYVCICTFIQIYTEGPSRKKSILWEVIVSVILGKNCICTCDPNGFRDSVNSFYSSKIVYKKEI